MEAATPLRHPSVRTVGDRLAIDGLVLDDECAVRLAREREDAGEDPARLVADAVEIGARVLDREQAGANAEFVRTEFEKVSREVEASFAERAGGVGELLAKQLDTVFDPESGHLARELERRFGDGSSDAVQHRVKEMVAELLAKGREEMLHQFSADDGRNPLADFKQGTMAELKRAAAQQDTHLQRLHEKLAAMELEVQRLHGERDKQLELAAERERGTAKGRTFEEAVFDAVEAIAGAQGDDAEAVGDTKGTTRKTGDVVVGVDGCHGPARGRIVFEAKDSRLSRPEAVRELDRARSERDAHYAVLVVPSEEELPARTRQLREMNGDKLFVVYDPEEGSRIALEVAYALARARVVMVRGGADGVDAAALGETVERALGAMEAVRAVKQQLTGANTSIDKARELLEAMAGTVRGHLEDMEALLAGATEDAA